MQAQLATPQHVSGDWGVIMPQQPSWQSVVLRQAPPLRTPHTLFWHWLLEHWTGSTQGVPFGSRKAQVPSPPASTDAQKAFAEQSAWLAQAPLPHSWVPAQAYGSHMIGGFIDVHWP